MTAFRYMLKISVFALPILLGANVCLSQVYDYGYGGGYPYPVDDRATTVGQSYMQGMSDVIRSQGAANLMNSQAAINATEAQKNLIQNREAWTDTYFQMRREQRAAVAEERGPRPTAEALVRYAKEGKPKDLSPTQLDPVTGKIYWPRALRADEFSASRSELDNLFAKRARYGDVSMDDLMAVRTITNKMVDQLKDQIRQIPTMEYTAAKQFLTSLAYIATQVAG